MARTRCRRRSGWPSDSRSRTSPGSRSRSARRTWRDWPSSGAVRRQGWRSPRASTSGARSMPSGCWRPAPSTCSRPTSPAAAGSPSCFTLEACAAPARCPSRPIAPRPSPLTLVAQSKRCSTSSTSTITSGSSRCCSREQRNPMAACCGPTSLGRASVSSRAPRSWRNTGSSEGGAPMRIDPHAMRKAPGVDEIDQVSLERALRATVHGEVYFDAGHRAAYSHDSSNYRQTPICVVVPRDADDIEASVAAAREHDAPVTPRGCGPSLAGAACNTAVVIDASKHMGNIVEIDPEARFARVQPGVIRDDLSRVTEEKWDLTFAPDTSTHEYATFGGMIGANSCGVHSVMAGRTVDNVRELEIVPYDGLRMRVGQTSDEELARIIAEGGRRGEIYSRMRDLRDRYADRIRERYPDIPRRVSGYNLNYLLPEPGFNVARALVGSESTLVTVLEATLELVPMPPCRSLLVLGYEDIWHAADHVVEIREQGAIALEAVDDTLIKDMKLMHEHEHEIAMLPEGKGWLLVEFGAETREEADEQARKCMKRLAKEKDAPTMKLLDKQPNENKLWQVREGGLGATAFNPMEADHWEGWEDAAVHP